MADLIIQPKNDDHLKLNNDAGTTILELANDESKLRLAQNNISASDGTTAITTSSANVTLAGTANNIGTATGTFNGQIGDSATGKVVKACEVYRISADFTASSGAMTNNWEIADDTAPEATFGQCISSVDQSTGVFTFSNDGFYLITVSWSVQNPSSVVLRTGCFIGIETCTDGSTFTEVARQMFAIDNAARNTSGSLFSLIDVTSTTNNKVRLMTFGNGQTVTYQGNSARNQTAISFLRLGDT